MKNVFVLTVKSHVEDHYGRLYVKKKPKGGYKPEIDSTKVKTYLTLEGAKKAMEKEAHKITKEYKIDIIDFGRSPDGCSMNVFVESAPESKCSASFELNIIKVGLSEQIFESWMQDKEKK